jgi:hypothetical protein
MKHDHFDKLPHATGQEIVIAQTVQSIAAAILLETEPARGKLDEIRRRCRCLRCRSRWQPLSPPLLILSPLGLLLPVVPVPNQANQQGNEDDDEDGIL